MGRRNINQLFEVDVTSFSKNGNGLGVVESPICRKVEVPFTMPGDQVQALLHRKKSGIYSSSLVEVIKPSPDRIKPRCLHFGVCGGCRSQHLSYPEQLKLKQKQIEQLFCCHLPPGLTINPIVACDPPWQYRNKMEFSFASDASGNQFVGLMMDSGRGKVVNLSECHLTTPWVIEALLATREWWVETGLRAYNPNSNQGALRTLTVREGVRTGDRLVMLTVSGNPEYALKKDQINRFVASLKGAIEPEKQGVLSLFLRIQQTAKGMATQFYEIHLYGPDHINEVLYIQPDANRQAKELTFSVSPSAFFQPNTKQAERLYSLALQSLDLDKDSVVYDLYCGTGTLGICVAGDASQVLGVEISPESSLDARTNVKNNGLKNVTILTGSVSDVITKIREEKSFPPPDVVMIDPPRSGLDAAIIQHLIDLNPKKILYISCNPKTQIENLISLKKGGYEIVNVQPVDQFPQTIHIENIVLLVRFS